MKAVYQIDPTTGSVAEEFPSVEAAAEAVNLHPNSIYRAIEEGTIAGLCEWDYAEQEKEIVDYLINPVTMTLEPIRK